MADFKELLILYRQKFNANQLIIEEIIKVINQLTKLRINKDNLIIKEGLIKFKVKPKEKIEILLHKDKILTEFQKAKIKITDLR